jgi:DNA-binding GntR family transcriptional regulator
MVSGNLDVCQQSPVDDSFASRQNAGMSIERVSPQHSELWETIRDYLAEEIVSGGLAPGMRLVEEDLASRLDVSRGPIRRAFADLEHLGLVEVKPRRGVRVVSLGPADVTELYVLREAIETASVTTAEPDRIAGAIDQLRTITDRLERSSSLFDSAQSIRADLEFHRLLLEMSGNRRLIAAWDTARAQVELTMSTVHRIAPEQWLARGVGATIDDHRLILNHLADGNPQAATERLREHLARARSVASANLEDWSRT